MMTLENLDPRLVDYYLPEENTGIRSNYNDRVPEYTAISDLLYNLKITTKEKAIKSAIGTYLYDAGFFNNIMMKGSQPSQYSEYYQNPTIDNLIETLKIRYY